jgi:cytochrome b6-f complex iron-sulfur subunit
MFPLEQKRLPFESELSRRRFFRLAGLALGMGYAALAAVFGLWTAALARFMMPNTASEPNQIFKAGFPTDYPAGTVGTKFKDCYRTWIVSFDYHGRQRIVALRAVCTHLGCITLWNENENRFKCPCHGSGFSLDGVNLEGPAPRPMDRYAIRLTDDGQLEIDRAKVFCYQRGREYEAGSFVEV